MQNNQSERQFLVNFSAFLGNGAQKRHHSNSRQAQDTLVCLLNGGVSLNLGGDFMRPEASKVETKKRRNNRIGKVQLWSLVLRYGVSSLKLILLGTVTFLLSTGTAYGAEVSRNLSSLRFPLVETERSVDDILESYPVYLKFVIEVGKDTDRTRTSQLVKTFESLKRKTPKGAALFLKGLRTEMIHKVDLMGSDPRSLTTSSPELRRWVSKYLAEWVREADEHLFRAYSASKPELALAE